MDVNNSSSTNYASLSFPPQFAADCLSITTRTLTAILKISRGTRGSVSARAYTLADIFRITAIRRDDLAQ